MSPSVVHFTVGGVVYELEVEDYTQGDPGSYWEPPESGEVELADKVTFDGGTLSLEQLIRRIATERDISVEDAATVLFQSAYEQEEQHRRNLSDDVEEYEACTMPREESD